MTSFVNKQSSQIVTLDGYPFTGMGGGSATGRLTAGMGAAGVIREISGSVILTTSDNGASANSYFQWCRLPSSCVLKSVQILPYGLATGTTITADVTVAISDSTTDGSNFTLQVLPSALVALAPMNCYIANPASTSTGLSGTAAAFAHATTIGSFTNAVWVELTYGTGVFSPLGYSQPLWQAVGYSSDPLCFMDIVGLTTQPLNILSTVILTVRARFVIPSG